MCCCFRSGKPVRRTVELADPLFGVLRMASVTATAAATRKKGTLIERRRIARKNWHVTAM
jgi:hypothetical protein